jgi:alkylhydroperoxidase family enzyme
MAAHTALAKQFGVTEELLDALYHIDTHSEMFTERELAALRFAEIMTTGARDVDESLWDELQAYFDDGEIVEIATVIGLFNFFNRYADALQLQPPQKQEEKATGEEEHGNQ